MRSDGGEAATVELDHRAQLRRNHRHGLEDHVGRLVLAAEERGDDLQALDRTCLLLTLGGLDLDVELLSFGLEVDLVEQVADGFCAHATTEVLAEAVRAAEALAQLTEE